MASEATRDGPARREFLLEYSLIRHIIFYIIDNNNKNNLFFFFKYVSSSFLIGVKKYRSSSSSLGGERVNRSILKRPKSFTI